jgi:hypothetical protein
MQVPAPASRMGSSLGDEESANAHIVTTYLPAGMQLLTAHASPFGDPHVEKRWSDLLCASRSTSASRPSSSSSTPHARHRWGSSRELEDESWTASGPASSFRWGSESWSDGGIGRSFARPVSRCNGTVCRLEDLPNRRSSPWDAAFCASPGGFRDTGGNRGSPASTRQLGPVRAGF